MRAQELRLGNYINQNDGNGFYQISVDIRILERLLASDWEFEPIPLTQEWLDKLGFEKRGRIMLPNIYGGEDWFDVNTVLFNEGIDAPVWGFEFSMNNERLKRVEYVHQLQNLYHALTSQELTIKPTEG